MTDSRAGGPGDEGLSFIHTRLEAHFQDLRARRDQYAEGIPIFALEHGLSAAELELLKAEVCSAVRERNLPRHTWLPFVVYAAEVGYEYSGDEYWQTFESRTPSWADHGDRRYVRQKFRAFKERFGGAEPTGAWAVHFSIICWPITHAVLPTDLQRQLVRLLFEYRHGLSSELLAYPAELGKRLAARSLRASPRFQNFAQNTDLLGQVAAALYSGEDEESPYLLDSTLKRIVEDLSEEKQARRWLRDAKSTATHVRKRGLELAQGQSGEVLVSGRVRLPSATDPEFLLRKEATGWVAYVELPDLTALAERLPSVHQELGRLPARFAGHNRPLARTRLLYPGQQLRLDEWPELGTPLITLENGSTEVNSLLSDQCVLSTGPRWLFRIRDPGLAAEVRGKFVRPGHSYVVLSRDVLSEELPSWISTTPCTTAGIDAYAVEVPSVLSSNDLAVLRAVGLGAVTEVEVRPAGLVPALWDGEGTAEWLAGEDPVVAVSSTRSVSQCIFRLDGEPRLIPWPAADQEVFIHLTDLVVGTHDLHISLLDADLEQPVAEGSLTVMIRAPHTRPSTGSVREGLMILATPITPTLSELWDGKAFLEVVGPADARVSIDMSLADRSHIVTARRRLSTHLPVNRELWESLFVSQFREAEEIADVYDESESCLVEISHPGLGNVSLRCDREFSPLRWAPGQDRGIPFVRLINHMEGGIDIYRYDFARPDHRVAIGISGDSSVRWPAGGLVTVSADSIRAGVILPPRVRNLDELRNMKVSPHLSDRPRVIGELQNLIQLAHLWAGASLPANPFAETQRVTVLRAITQHLCVLVGGSRWERAEHRFALDVRNASVSGLQEAVGDQAYQRELADDLGRQVGTFRALRPEDRAQPFSTVLSAHASRAGIRGDDPQFAEFLLRLASEPGSLVTWPFEDLQSGAQLALASPVLLRSARFIVLAVQALASSDGRATYGGWSWE
jgi:hypothetical protein